MKLIRPALALALASSLAGVAAAEAKVAPKPICNLITDPAGDAALIGSPAPDPNVDTLDILSADVMTDTKNVSVAIRVKKLAKSSPEAPDGMGWSFTFTTEGQVLSLSAHVDPLGEASFGASHKTPDEKTGHLYDGGVNGVLDLAKNEVRMTAPLSLFASEASLKKGTALETLGATASLDIIVPDKTKKVAPGGTILSSGLSDDTATSEKTYKAGTSSCVVPVK